ncbi:MAG TPA: c-type cytochrome biogenesis protein CcmI, partial [Pyrinomonadaceae bacterium]|nr:c-type cytochrome biogenesis protein CcmI [Pyrinomonadaceae bacterium]
MITFWIICAIFVAIALAFVLPPLLQAAQPATADGADDHDRNQANVDIYRDQISELEADVANGIVSPEQYQQDRDEIERRMLQDVSAARVEGKGSDQKLNAAAVGRTPVYAVAVGIPLIAVALYMQVGNRSALSGSPAPVGRAAQAPAEAAQPAGQMSQQAIEANVAKLAARMEQNPSDVQGWIMLGRSYVNLEKYNEASNAYAKASALKPDDADLLGDYAFALGMANGQRLDGKPLELINRALKI